MSSEGTGYRSEYHEADGDGCAVFIGLVIVGCLILGALGLIKNKPAQKVQEVPCVEQIKISTEAAYWDRGMFREPKWMPATQTTYKICGDKFWTFEVLERKLLE